MQPPKDHLSIRMNRNTYALLKEAAQREDRKMTQVMDRALRLYTTGQRDRDDATP